MTSKKIIKLILLSVGILFLFILIYSVIPRVSNPSLKFQTELAYGNSVSNEVRSVLTPKTEPKRTRAIVIS